MIYEKYEISVQKGGDNMEKIIQYENVCKKYGDKVVLDNFSLNIEKGEFIVVVGTSGSGKTTIMKMINGLVKPDSGCVKLNGENIDSKDIISLRRQIGYAIQGNALFPHMSVRDNIAYTLNLQKADRKTVEKTVDEKLKLVGLPLELKDRFPSELSGGQQQRVGIARAYASSPEILLMDEPFGAVDAITRCQLQKDLKKIHRETECTIVFITHDISEALKLGTKILVLDGGKIQQYDVPEKIKNEPANSFVKTLIEMAL